MHIQSPDTNSGITACTIQSSTAPVAQRRSHDLLEKLALFQSSFENRAAFLIYSLWPPSRRSPRRAHPDATRVVAPLPAVPPAVAIDPVVIEPPAATEVVNYYTAAGVEVGRAPSIEHNTRGAAVEESMTIPTLKKLLAIASQCVWGVVLRAM